MGREVRRERHGHRLAGEAPSDCSISAMWRWPVGVYGWTPPWTSLRCVCSVGSRPAPETPDLPSIATGRVEQARLGQRRQREHRRGRVAAGVGDLARVEHVLAEQLGQAVGPAADRAGSRSRGRRPACRRAPAPRRTPGWRRAAGRGTRRRSARARPARARRSPPSAPERCAARAADGPRSGARARDRHSRMRPQFPRSARAKLRQSARSRSPESP